MKAKKTKNQKTQELLDELCLIFKLAYKSNNAEEKAILQRIGDRLHSEREKWFTRYEIVPPQEEREMPFCP
jgi:hypothetical protein